MASLKSFNPADGTLIQEVPVTPIEGLPALFTQARQAQVEWGALPIESRASHLIRLRETILDGADDLISLISEENGKPRFEALANEVIPAAAVLTFFASRAPHTLKDHPIPMSVMKHRVSYLNRWPLGVVTVISAWNYPFLLPFGEIVMAVISGNSVVFKPSEVTPLVGLRIQELFDRAGFPKNVVQTAIGDGTLGAAIIQQKPNKIFFTGSVQTGRRIMSAAAEHLIPVSLELGGKDAMIVLADADLDHASSAALWGGFANAGQACASVERILVHDSIIADFTERLKAKLARLRQGPSTNGGNDLGPVTFDGQKEIYATHLDEARRRNATISGGGHLSEDGRFFTPSLVTGPEVKDLLVFREETFGPTVAITSFKTVDEAVTQANDSSYGLLASVFSRDLEVAERVARRLEAGTVLVNEVTYTAALPETPWGGLKNSGFGRKHSLEGLLEFVNTRHIHKPRASMFVFKSLWWFPYSPQQYASFRQFLNLYRSRWPDKLKAIPPFIRSALQLILREPRL